MARHPAPNEPNSKLMEEIIRFWTTEERPPTYKELGKSLNLDPAGIFRQVQRLRDIGAVKRGKWIVPMSISISFDQKNILKRAGLV